MIRIQHHNTDNQRCLRSNKDNNHLSRTVGGSKVGGKTTKGKEEKIFDFDWIAQGWVEMEQAATAAIQI
jgi:hypothetical protein